MIQARADARKAKDFAEADRIRDDLLEKGIILDDSEKEPPGAGARTELIRAMSHCTGGNDLVGNFTYNAAL